MFRSILKRLRELLGGEPSVLFAWLEGRTACAWSSCFLAIVVGCGVYGSTIGLWRSGEQSLYAAVKFPLVVLLTCFGNVLLNGILAQVYATGLSVRQTTLAILMSFAISSVVMLSIAPLAYFLLWNTPPLSSEGAASGHSLTLLLHVGAIGCAGVIGNWKLYALLRYAAPLAGSARSSLAAWLAGNLLLGSQVSWILRPFIGNPKLPVEFLRDRPLEGNFFEQVEHSLSQLLF